MTYKAFSNLKSMPKDRMQIFYYRHCLIRIDKVPSGYISVVYFIYKNGQIYWRTQRGRGFKLLLAKTLAYYQMRKKQYLKEIKNESNKNVSTFTRTHARKRITTFSS